MSSLNNVDGREFDGSCSSVIVGSTVMTGGLKASYSDGLEKGDVTPMGTQGIFAITRGTYKVSDLKLTLLSSVARLQLFPLFPAVGFGNVPFPITVVYTHPDLGSDSDLLIDCYITNLSAAIENANKAYEIETTWKVRGIQWSDDRLKIYDDGVAGDAVSGGGGITFGFSITF